MKTKTVLLRGVEIGAGRPKIIVPIVGKTEQEILDKAAQLVQAKPDVVEWRVDYFQGVGDVQRVVDTARQLNEALGEIPILFTFRTKREGGEKEIGMEDYTALNRAVASRAMWTRWMWRFFPVTRWCARTSPPSMMPGAAVVGSSHEFHRTPEHAELIYRLRKMQDMGADILKVAVMPQNKADVLTLLSATEEMYRLYGPAAAADHVHGVGRRHQPPGAARCSAPPPPSAWWARLSPRPDPGGSTGTGAGDPPQSAVSPDILSEQGGE